MDIDATSASDPPQESLVPGLYWGVRESFIGYVQSNPDGQVYGDDGVETDGQGVFRFPLHRARFQEAGWQLNFSGSLRFLAHFGALDVTLARPDVDLASGTLLIDTPSGRIPLAEIATAEPTPVDEWLVWPPLAIALTAQGADLFGGAYGEGAPLAPLRIAVPRTVASSIETKMET